MIKGLFALALAIFLCSPTNASAAQVLFTPAVVLGGEITDNLFLDFENEENEFISSAGLDLKGQLLWRTAGIELQYIPTYNSFAENDEFNYWRHQAAFSTWKMLARNTRFELRDTYLRTNDPTDESPNIERDGIPQGSEIEIDRNRRGRNEYETNVAQVRLNHQFGTDDSFFVAYKYSYLKDIDPINEENVDDNDIHTPSIGLIYNFSPRWGIELNALNESTDYADEDLNDRDESYGNIRLLHSFNRAFSGYVDYQYTILNFDEDFDEDYTISEPSLGIRYDFRDNARIEIAMGFYAQDFEEGEDKDGYNVTSKMFKRWTFRTGYFTISGDSGYVIDDNGTEDNGFNIYYQVGIGSGYNFTSRFAGTIHSSYRHDEYPNEDPERDQNKFTAGLGFEWQMFQWMAAGLSFDHSAVTSDVETDEYAENRAMITIRMAPSSPFRLN